MNPTLIGMLVFVCTFGGALFGIWLRAILPEHHRNNESKDTVKVGIGLVATMTALVLGLVTASAKQSFDELDAAIKHAAAQVLSLDRALARYGPESAEARQALHDGMVQRVEFTWRQDTRQPAQLPTPELIRAGEGIITLVRHLSPRDDDQRWLQSRALELGEGLLKVSPKPLLFAISQVNRQVHCAAEPGHHRAISPWCSINNLTGRSNNDVTGLHDWAAQHCRL